MYRKCSHYMYIKKRKKIQKEKHPRDVVSVVEEAGLLCVPSFDNEHVKDLETFLGNYSQHLNRLVWLPNCPPSSKPLTSTGIVWNSFQNHLLYQPSQEVLVHFYDAFHFLLKIKIEC